MKKRAFWGAAAPLAIGLLLVPSAFADTLDYAESIGQIEANDTINYVIEATSDGGYVVGGQTIQCYKYEDDGLAKGPTDDGEKVALAECLESMSFGGGVEKSKSLKPKVASMPMIVEICSSGSPKGGKGGDDYYYSASCLDYIAKFKQNGTKEWLSVIDDSDRPVAVGETSADYRLLTTRGALYTFAKTTGTEDQSLEIAVDYIYDAIINNDSTITAIDEDNGIAVYGANGNLLKALPEEINGDSYDGYGRPGSLVRSGNSIIIVHDQSEYDDESGTTTGSATIERFSTSLDGPVAIVEMTYAELEDENIDDVEILSADQDGNILIGVTIYDEETDSFVPYFAVVDKNGELVEMKEADEVVAGADSISAPVMYLDDLTVVSLVDGKLMRLSPNLEPTESYDLGEGEMIFDVAALKDGSLAGVGFSTASTANYTVDGGMNGTYLRLTAKKPNATNNPNTDDNSKIFVFGGGIVAVTLLGLAMIASKRR